MKLVTHMQYRSLRHTPTSVHAFQLLCQLHLRTTVHWMGTILIPQHERCSECTRPLHGHGTHLLLTMTIL